MSTTRPDFALEPYEDAPLPEGKRLMTEEDLVGHTIKAVVRHPMGRLGEEAEMVIVTGTLCWMVLQTEDSYSCEERASITVSGGKYGYSTTETLFDYLGASEMFRYGLVSAAQRDALLEIEAAAEQKETQEKAARLRKELADLEGGAA
jgi:hypothetical protein